MKKYQCMFTENQIKVMKMAIENAINGEVVEYNYNGVSTSEVLNLLNNVIKNIEEEREIHN